MWIRVLLKCIRRGLAAVMIAGLSLLYVGPPIVVPALSYTPLPMADSMVAINLPVLSLPENTWVGLRLHSLGLSASVFGPQIKRDPAPNEPLGEPIPIVPAEQACREDGVKRAYLTFDDGPTPGITVDILDTLDTYGIKATFFVVGRMAAQHPDLLRQIHNEGHAIANHSYTHRYGCLYRGVTAFSRDLKRADALIRTELGPEYALRLYRFPGGTDWPMPMGRFFDACTQAGYCHVEWNALNGDAEDGGGKSVAELMERLRESCAGKEDVIILMHDAPGKETTAEALPRAIEYLRSEGYQFCLLR